jgi:hypothetical protein
MFSAPAYFLLSGEEQRNGEGTDHAVPGGVPRKVRPPAVRTRVADLGCDAGAGGVQARPVPAFVLDLIEAEGQWPGVDDGARLVLDQQRDRCLRVAGHDSLGEVGHRLQQALHGEFPQGQLAQMLQRLGGCRGTSALIAGHRRPPV